MQYTCSKEWFDKIINMATELMKRTPLAQNMKNNEPKLSEVKLNKVESAKKYEEFLKNIKELGIEVNETDFFHQIMLKFSEKLNKI